MGLGLNISKSHVVLGNIMAKLTSQMNKPFARQASQWEL